MARTLSLESCLVGARNDSRQHLKRRQPPWLTVLTMPKQKLNRNLEVAVYEGNSKNIRNVIKAGANPNTKINGSTMAEYCLKHNDMESLKCLIECGAEYNLQTVLKCNNTESMDNGMKLLLELNRVDANEKVMVEWSGPNIYSILDFCVRNGLPKSTAYLIDHNANLMETNSDGENLWHVWANGATTEWGEIDYVNDYKMVHRALQEGLKRKGADREVSMSHQRNDGQTPLHILASPDEGIPKIENKDRLGQFISTHQLANMPSETLNCQDSNGDTALILAIYYDQDETARMLIEAGADLNIANNKGETAMFHALDKKSKAKEEAQNMGKWINIIKLLKHHGNSIQSSGREEVKEDNVENRDPECNGEMKDSNPREDHLNCSYLARKYSSTDLKPFENKGKVDNKREHKDLPCCESGKMESRSQHDDENITVGINPPGGPSISDSYSLANRDCSAFRGSRIRDKRLQFIEGVLRKLQLSLLKPSHER